MNENLFIFLVALGGFVVHGLSGYFMVFLFNRASKEKQAKYKMKDWIYVIYGLNVYDKDSEEYKSIQSKPSSRL